MGRRLLRNLPGLESMVVALLLEHLSSKGSEGKPGGPSLVQLEKRTTLGFGVPTLGVANTKRANTKKANRKRAVSLRLGDGCWLTAPSGLEDTEVSDMSPLLPAGRDRDRRPHGGVPAPR